MRIATLETLHADGGRRVFDFVKVTTHGGAPTTRRWRSCRRSAARRRAASSSKPGTP